SFGNRHRVGRRMYAALRRAGEFDFGDDVVAILQKSGLGIMRRALEQRAGLERRYGCFALRLRDAFRRDACDFLQEAAHPAPFMACRFFRARPSAITCFARSSPAFRSGSFPAVTKPAAALRQMISAGAPSAPSKTALTMAAFCSAVPPCSLSSG